MGKSGSGGESKPFAAATATRPSQNMESYSAAPRLKISGEWRGTNWRPSPSRRSGPRRRRYQSGGRARRARAGVGGGRWRRRCRDCRSVRDRRRELLRVARARADARIRDLAAAERVLLQRGRAADRGHRRCSRRARAGTDQQPDHATVQVHGMRPPAGSCCQRMPPALPRREANGPDQSRIQVRATVPAGRHRWSYSTILGGCVSSAHAGHVGLRRTLRTRKSWSRAS